MGKGKSRLGYYGLGFYCQDSGSEELRKVYPEVPWLEIPSKAMRDAYSTATHNPELNPLSSSLQTRSPSSIRGKTDVLLGPCIIYFMADSGSCREMLMISSGNPREIRRAAKRLGLEEHCTQVAAPLNPSKRIV